MAKSNCRKRLFVVKPWSQDWLIAGGAYPGFCSMKRLVVFLLPLDRMLVHRRSPQQFTGTHLYNWVERGTVKVKFLAQEHNTMSPARARTRTARSRVEHSNQEATAPIICLTLLNMATIHASQVFLVRLRWLPTVLIVSTPEDG